MDIWAAFISILLAIGFYLTAKGLIDYFKGVDEEMDEHDPNWDDYARKL